MDMMQVMQHYQEYLTNTMGQTIGIRYHQAKELEELWPTPINPFYPTMQLFALLLSDLMHTADNMSQWIHSEKLEGIHIGSKSLEHLEDALDVIESCAKDMLDVFNDNPEYRPYLQTMHEKAHDTDTANCIKGADELTEKKKTKGTNPQSQYKLATDVVSMDPKPNEPYKPFGGEIPMPDLLY